MSVITQIHQEIPKHNVYELGIETTKLLSDRQDELSMIRWTNSESNLDSEYSKLACDCCITAWDTMKQKYPNYNKIDISCIIPDINITFRYPSGRESNHKIELKSSKKTKMLGSTIIKLDINQPLIYCLRPKGLEPYILRCSQYYNAMEKSDVALFQERSPRPPINFNKMYDNQHFEKKEKKYWDIEHYATCALNRIDESISCKHSWQDDMVEQIKKKAIEEFIRKTSVEQFDKTKNIL